MKLLLFAKNPRTESVKTRLAKGVGKLRAVEIYENILCSIIQRLTPIIYYRGGKNYFQTFKVPLKEQEGEDLGIILTTAFKHELPEKVIAIGADCPTVTQKDIEAAAQALDNNDLVIGPANDGGYWLIGMKELHEELFQDIDWSTERVLEQTLENATGLKIKLLQEKTDIDTVEDYESWRRSK